MRYVYRIRDSQRLNAGVEKLAAPLHEVQWNISYASRASAAQSADTEEESSDESFSGSDSDEDWPFL